MSPMSPGPAAGWKAGGIERVARSIWPFWLAMLAVLLLVTYLPFLAMTIPNAVRM